MTEKEIKEFFINSVYYGKPMKEFTNDEKELFSIDIEFFNHFMLRESIKEEPLILSLMEMTGREISDRRLVVTDRLLKITNDDINNFTTEEITDVLTGSVYCFRKFLDNHFENCRIFGEKTLKNEFDFNLN